MKRLFDVYWFHFLQAVKSKGFIFSSVVIVVLILGFAIFNFFTNETSQASTLKFTVYNQTQQYQFDAADIRTTLQASDETIEYVLVTDIPQAEAETAIAEQVIDAAIFIREVNGQPQLEFFFKNTPYRSLVFATESVVKNKMVLAIAQTSDIAPETLTQLQQPLPTTISQVDEVVNSDATALLIYAFAFLFYIFALTFGNLIASNIVSEKSSRVMEVMISKVKPLTLMYGKILAVLSLGLVQLAVIGITIGIISATGLLDFGSVSVMDVALDFSVLTPTIVITFIIFLLLGFALYAILFAAVGASVSKMEQLGNASFPVVLLAIAAFFIGISAMNAPTSTLVTVSAYIPFFSPIAEYARILAGVAQPLEIILSISILLITIFVINRIAARVYTNGVMSYHEKWSWKTFFSLLRKH